MMLEETPKKKNHSTLLIVLLLLVIAGLCAYIFLGKKQENNSTEAQSTAKTMESEQSEYVKPEEPVDRSKNVVLPGWGGFTIPANSKEITQGFEFHNPEENFWYEDWVSINGTELEKLVVDSGNQTELNHYLKLARNNSNVAKVTQYDKNCFNISRSEDGAYIVDAIDHFDDTKTITVETEDGDTVNLEVKCQSNCYYMTFGLYLDEGDELLYQSDLVSPGKYIQKMEMTRSLEPGTYDAYVVCQPYKSDKVTETNQGVVRITLTVQ